MRVEGAGTGDGGEQNNVVCRGSFDTLTQRDAHTHRSSHIHVLNLCLFSLTYRNHIYFASKVFGVLEANLGTSSSLPSSSNSAISSSSQDLASSSSLPSSTNGSSSSTNSSSNLIESRLYRFVDPWEAEPLALGDAFDTAGCACVVVVDGGGVVVDVLLLVVLVLM